jgi:hypothetical protein
MGVALKRKKGMNRGDRGRVSAPDPHFPTARPLLKPAGRDGMKQDP